MNQNSQIPNRKLTLPTAEEISIEASVILSLPEKEQLTLMKINF
jgi:hypothetical protein